MRKHNYTASHSPRLLPQPHPLLWLKRLKNKTSLVLGLLGALPVRELPCSPQGNAKSFPVEEKVQPTERRELEPMASQQKCLK